MIIKILGFIMILIGGIIIFNNLTPQTIGYDFYYQYNEDCHDIYYDASWDSCYGTCCNYYECKEVEMPKDKCGIEQSFYEEIVETVQIVNFYSPVCLDDSDCDNGERCIDKKCSDVYWSEKENPDILAGELKRASLEVENQVNEYWNNYMQEKRDEGEQWAFTNNNCYDGTPVGECNNRGLWCSSQGFIPDAQGCGCPDDTESYYYEVIQNVCVAKDYPSKFGLNIVNLMFGLFLIIGGFVVMRK